MTTTTTMREKRGQPEARGKRVGTTAVVSTAECSSPQSMSLTPPQARAGRREAAAPHMPLRTPRVGHRPTAPAPPPLVSARMSTLVMLPLPLTTMTITSAWPTRVQQPACVLTPANPWCLTRGGRAPSRQARSPRPTTNLDRPTTVMRAPSRQARSPRPTANLDRPTSAMRGAPSRQARSPRPTLMWLRCVALAPALADFHDLSPSPLLWQTHPLWRTRPHRGIYL